MNACPTSRDPRAGRSAAPRAGVWPPTRGALLDVLRRHGVTNPEVFGSTARGDDGKGSDVDILVDFPTGTSIIDIIGIQRELEQVLGVHVDLVPRSGLKDRVRRRATKDPVPL